MPKKNAIVSPSSSLVLHRQSDHIINTDTHTWVENTFGKTRMMTEVPWSIFMVQNIEVWQFDQLVVCMQQYQLKCYDRFFLSTCLSDQFLLPIEFSHQSILLLIDFGNWFGNWFWRLILATDFATDWFLALIDQFIYGVCYQWLFAIYLFPINYHLAQQSH